ncbi:MAG TPA: DUF3857 domain-containing protein [Acidobacteriota bacterium]|nr:DUF3857 domain-containing protein [Acidobacteriota bacterium]
MLFILMMVRAGTFILALLLAVSAHAITSQHFEPLKDTLARYNVLRIPNASEYPEIPAVGLLSVTEYNQIGNTHERKIHRIIKILTSAGKEHTRVRIPCYSSCRLEGRTIKADGTIVSVPSRDLIRSEKLTEYTAPVSVVRFAFPAVEPGDIIEFKATVMYQYPFYIDDFYFAEPYPLLKSVLILIHPEDHSYFYTRGGGTTPIGVKSDQYLDGSIRRSRTMFSVENVKAAEREPYSPDTYEGQPHVRLVMDGRLGERIDFLKNWFEFGSFISELSRISSLPDPKVAQFVKETVGKETNPAVVIPLLYRKADQQITIVKKTLVQSGFNFQDPKDTFEKKLGTPQDFALFLASCFKFLKIDSELALVNSHRRPAASKENAFPLDLDLVFLNAKGAKGEFLLDCNANGMPPGGISSEAMNRFALVVPIGTEVNTRTMTPFLTTMLFKDGNKVHLDLNLTPATDGWNADFRWYLGGELQREWIDIYRQQGEAALKRELAVEARSRIHAEKLQSVEYSFVGNGIEVKGKGTIRRSKNGPKMEAVLNDLWDPGFGFSQYIIDGRSNPLLLPLAGEISSTVNIQLEPGTEPVLPASTEITCTPLRYSIVFSRTKQQLQINETLSMRDMLVRPALFPKFAEFLNRYNANHFWMILMSPEFKPAAQPAPQKITLAGGN